MIVTTEMSSTSPMKPKRVSQKGERLFEKFEVVLAVGCLAEVVEFFICGKPISPPSAFSASSFESSVRELEFV